MLRGVAHALGGKDQKQLEMPEFVGLDLCSVGLGDTSTFPDTSFRCEPAEAEKNPEAIRIPDDPLTGNWYSPEFATTDKEDDSETRAHCHASTHHLTTLVHYISF
jgi:hypothetical protein